MTSCTASASMGAADRRTQDQRGRGRDRPSHLRGVRCRSIATGDRQTLNAEGVRGPIGRDWGPSTIHGNRQRGTGILNNELYIGRLVWNRLRYVKDPDTGKRVSRLNPDSGRIVQDVAELRIIDQELWERVKARQGALAGTVAKCRRRARLLGPAAPALSVLRADAVRRLRRRDRQFQPALYRLRERPQQRHLRQSPTMRRDELEALVLDGLQNRLMEPARIKIFCEEYARAMNRLHVEHNARRAAKEEALAKAERDLARLVQALGRHAGLGRAGEDSGTRGAKGCAARSPCPGRGQRIRLRPNMAGYYVAQIADLRAALTESGRRSEAAEIVRELVDRIELSPVVRQGRKTLSVSLYRRLADFGDGDKSKGAAR